VDVGRGELAVFSTQTKRIGISCVCVCVRVCAHFTPLVPTQMMHSRASSHLYQATRADVLRSEHRLVTHESKLWAEGMHELSIKRLPPQLIVTSHVPPHKCTSS
jgi:hypothetical protein